MRVNNLLVGSILFNLCEARIDGLKQQITIRMRFAHHDMQTFDRQWARLHDIHTGSHIQILDRLATCEFVQGNRINCSLRQKLKAIGDTDRLRQSDFAIGKPIAPVLVQIMGIIPLRPTEHFSDDIAVLLKPDWA